MALLARKIRRIIRTSRRAVRNVLISAMTRPLVFCMGWLSPNTAKRLSCALANCACKFNLQVIDISCQNLAVAFPDYTPEQRRELARSSFQHAIQLAFETMRILRKPQLVKQLLVPMQQTMIDELTQQANIVCIPHLGNWEILAQAIPLQGVTCSAVAETLNNHALDQLMTRAREHNGLKIILRHGAARKVLSALKHKEAVGLLVDQNLSPKEGGVFADFFGLPASTVPLPALLARKLKVNVMVIASVRTEEGKFAVIRHKLPKAIADYQSDQELTQDIIHAFEDMVRQYPDQYTWSYKRWRYLPCNVPENARKQFPPYAVVKPYELQADLLKKLCEVTS